MIGYYDLIVAATAIERASQLATFNIRHFSHVKGLHILEPAQRSNHQMLQRVSVYFPGPIQSLPTTMELGGTAIRTEGISDSCAKSVLSPNCFKSNFVVTFFMTCVSQNLSLRCVVSTSHKPQQPSISNSQPFPPCHTNRFRP